MRQSPMCFMADPEQQAHQQKEEVPMDAEVGPNWCERPPPNLEFRRGRSEPGAIGRGCEQIEQGETAQDR